MDVLKTVADYISANRLLTPDGMHLVALSGGADSVALLLIMQKLGYRVEAVHCNFHLRGEESDRDENFVKSLCCKNNVPLHIVHFDTKTYSELHHKSIELAARDLRYGYFERLRTDTGAESVCVAHHRDDNVETVLMNIVRGTGIHGLAGIRPRNGYIIRPLLCLSREAIENWLMSVSQEYVTDSTNLELDATRNRYRLKVVPLLNRINPSASENICRTSKWMAEACRIFEEAISRHAGKVIVSDTLSVQKTAKNGTSREEAYSYGSMVVDIGKLKSTPSPEYVLYWILRDYGFSSAQAEQISLNLDGRTGAYYSSGCFELVIDRGKIIVCRKQKPFKPLSIPEPGNYMIYGRMKISITPVEIDDSFVIPKDRTCICIDAANVKFPFVLRTVADGDRFIPFGMRGSKLVSDYLTDCKKSIIEKRSQLILTDSTGMPMWLVCERPDNRVCITDKSSTGLMISVFPY